MTNRPGRPGDLEPLLDLWEALMACGQEADPRFEPHADGREAMREHMRAWFAPADFPTLWVADDAGLVGFVNTMVVRRPAVVTLAPTVRITDLFVSASHRRRGIARDLVTTVLDAARKAGFPRAEVGTLTADARAVGFWKSVGFGDWQVLLSR